MSVGVDVVSVKTNVGYDSSGLRISVVHSRLRIGTHQPVPLKKKMNVEPWGIANSFVKDVGPK